MGFLKKLEREVKKAGRDIDEGFHDIGDFIEDAADDLITAAIVIGVGIATGGSSLIWQTTLRAAGAGVASAYKTSKKVEAGNDRIRANKASLTRNIGSLESSQQAALLRGSSNIRSAVTDAVGGTLGSGTASSLGSFYGASSKNVAASAVLQQQLQFANRIGATQAQNDSLKYIDKDKAALGAFVIGAATSYASNAFDPTGNATSKLGGVAETQTSVAIEPVTATL